MFWINDSEVNYTEFNFSDYIPYSERPETYIVPVVLVIVFLVGTLGNGTLLYIFLKNKSMRSVPNMFIISLSIGDLIVIIGSVPFIGTVYIVESWPYGELICKLSEFLKDVSVGVTVLTLTVLSIDRYLATVVPMQKYKNPHSKYSTFFITVGIWCASIGLAVPGAHYSYILHLKGRGKFINVCYPFPLHLMLWYPRTIVLVKFFLLYTLPLIIISTFYVFMARHLLLSLRNNIGQNDSHIKHMRARSKVARIVLALVIVFAICFFPNHVFMLWFYFHPNSLSLYNEFWNTWKICSYVLTFVNSCMNPITLCIISGVFRSYFRKYLFCCCCPVKKKKRFIHFGTKSSSRSNSRLTTSTRV
ncbi:neuropeptide CCHamide-1 receptor-like [Centruroides vittatus]|uniref:neuropeptide CCHamide-1 receptor-like n=1 Tax=Centruroides vittatus TaxID=120091 RepID=UPI00350EA76E